MIIYRKLFVKDINYINNLISVEKNNYEKFLRIGWSSKQILSQLSKNINLSYGGFYNNSLVSFILGDLFNIEKISEYEILLLYVCNKFRNKGLGSKLLNTIKEDNNCLKKIYLEVSEDNLKGISFYNKMNFKNIYIRKNYYLVNKQNINAFVMSKNY